MPQINYSNTIIYKIVCNDLNITECYIGHTTNFRHRKTEHKSSCCNINDKSYHLKVYGIIRKNGGWDNWSMIEIEKYPCIDGNEARARERYWFENFNAKMNVKCPLILKEEYLKNKREQNKVYYNDNVEELKEYKKQQYQKNKEKLRAQIKKYREENKDKINARRRELRFLKKQAEANV